MAGYERGVREKGWCSMITLEQERAGAQRLSRRRTAACRADRERWVPGRAPCAPGDVVCDKPSSWVWETYAAARQQGLRPGVPMLVLAVLHQSPPSGPVDVLGWRLSLLLCGPAGVEKREVFSSDLRWLRKAKKAMP